MSGQSIIDRVRDRLESEEPQPDLTMTYTTRGGAPSEAFDEEVRLEGTGEVTLRVSDELGWKPVGEGSGTLTDEERTRVFAATAAGLDHLVPRSEAEFTPDATVGAIAFALDDEQRTLYYDAGSAYDQIWRDGDETPTVEEPAAPLGDVPFAHLLYRLHRIEQRLLGGDT